jgi:hypothetical protein
VIPLPHLRVDTAAARERGRKSRSGIARAPAARLLHRRQRFLRPTAIAAPSRWSLLCRRHGRQSEDPGGLCWSSLTIGQLTPDEALFDWRVVNRFEMILHQNAFDGPRSHRALHLCCDIATKTTAVDKRGDLSDIPLMIVQGVARTGRR